MTTGFDDVRQPDAKTLSRPMKMGSTVQRLPEFTRKVAGHLRPLNRADFDLKGPDAWTP